MMKVETWLNHEIRFVQLEGEWWAVAKDVAVALDYRDSHNMTRLLDQDEKDTHQVSTLGGKQNMTIISEMGIYEAVFNSEKAEAKIFKKWIKQTLKELRKQSGLESYQAFRMMDKDHQKSIMENLQVGLPKAERRHYIKANTIANKAISTKYGYSKMIKKGDMTDEMLAERQPILNDTAELMVAKERFNLDIKVSDVIYDKHTH